jgi:hypothetical protein
MVGTIDEAMKKAHTLAGTQAQDLLSIRKTAER